MKLRNAAVASALAGVFATLALSAHAQTAPSANSKEAQFKAEEKSLQKESTNMSTMTAAQSAQYRAEYQAAKAKWASLTPQEQAAAIASARQKKIMDLTAMERVGQRDDMMRETAAQSAALKAEADAAQASWDKMTAAQKQAVRKASWAKKRAELTAMERVGQRDDMEVLPW